MKAVRRFAICLCTLVLLMPTFASAVDDGFRTSYTYTYDYWGDAQESPDAYQVSMVINSASLGMDKLGGINMLKPQSLFVRNNMIYVCDTSNNRILEIRKKTNSEYQLVRVISEMQGTTNNQIKSPYDCYVDEEGNIYVADYGNSRVTLMDKNLNWICDYVKPTDATFDQGKDFLPKKLVVDVAGRVYVLAQNINKGLIKYEADGTFTGFIGANQVTISTGEYIWKRYFQTKEQQAASISFVPTEYENIAIDSQGFIYATNTVFEEYQLKSDSAKPIRRINNLGSDILIKNDKFPPIGELNWVSGSTAAGPSKLTDITVMENDIYVALDRIRGRVFGYDSQGVLLWAFGTKGNVRGAFVSAISIESMGRDLLVLDQVQNSITVFTPTEYGNLVYDATDAYLNGNYEESANLWQEVIRMNANYPLAFRGIGRAILREDKFEEAMKYFELAHDRESYGRAFKLYRKEWVEKNIWWIIVVIAVLLIVPLIIGRVKRMRWEVAMHEHSKVHK